MKKVWNITGWIIVAFLTVVFAVAIAVQSPKVQTYLAEKAVAMLKDKLGGDITFDSIHVRPFDVVVISDVAVTDTDPYGGGPFARQDTLFRAESISAKFSLKGLFNKTGVKASYAKVSNGLFTLTTEPGDITNLARIFNLKPADTLRQKNTAEIFSIDRVVLDNMEFRMLNFKKPYAGVDGGINWSDLRVTDIKLKGRNLRMKGGVMEGTADELSFREQSGYIVERMSGSTAVGNGRTVIKDLRFKDILSDLSIPELIFTYENTRSWSDFVNRVIIDARIKESRLDFGSIAYFAPALQRNSIRLTLNAKIHGTVNDLNVSGLDFRSGNGTFGGRLHGRISDVTSPEKIALNCRMENIAFNSGGLEHFLKGWAPDSGIHLERFAKGIIMTMDGTAEGPLGGLRVKSLITAPDRGNLYADLMVKNLTAADKDITIGGNISTEDLDLGDILDMDVLGKCSMSTGLSAVLSPGMPSLKIDSLQVSRLGAMGYDYSGIAANGIYENAAFDGRVICSDPNLNFMFQGILTPSAKTKNAIYQFYANIGYADLHAMNLDSRKISRMSLQTSANFRVMEDKNVIGNIELRDVVLQDAAGTHNVGDITIASHANDNMNRIRLSSGFANGSYVGTAFLGDFISDIKALAVNKEMQALGRPDAKNFSGNSYDLSLKLQNANEVLTFFMPGGYVADSTAFEMSIAKDGTMDLGLKSQRLAFRNKYLKGLEVMLNNRDSSLNGQILADEISYPPMLMKKGHFLAYANDGHVGIGFSYDNDTELANKGEIYLAGRMDRTEADSLRIRGEMLPSGIYFNGESWTISPAEIGFYGGDIKVRDFSLTSSGQSIHLDGGFSKNHNDTLNLNLNRFDIGIVNSFLKKDMAIKGTTTGKAMLISPTENMGLLVNLTTTDGEIAGEPLGTLRIASVWNDESEAFELRALNELDGGRNIDLSGKFVPGEKTVDGTLALRSFNIGYFEPVVSDILSSMSGSLSGDIAFRGPVSKLNIESSEAMIDAADFMLDFTKVPYSISGPVSITSRGISLHSLLLTDRYGAMGNVDGGISWKDFKDMKLGVGIRMNGMEVLNTSEKDNSSFYGNVFASGNVDITGPFNSILLDINATTEKNGRFHIPMGNSGAGVQSNLLTFKQPYDNIRIDPYEEMMERLNSTEKTGSDLAVKLNINVHQGLEGIVEIDRETGNILTGRGTGLIQLDVRPSSDIFNLGGSYNISSGNYHFEQLGIVKKDFSIQDGSSIHFNGDIMESNLDINALYKLKTSVGTLIADTTSTSRRNVDCGIAISGKLRDPRISFSIDIPDLDPITQARVENALSTEDQVQKQFLSLLVSGGFLPDERSGVTNNTSMLNSTVSEIMANQLSNILQKLNIPLDLGLDYQTSSRGTNIFDVAVSTELFDNRVIINGTIGNRQYGQTSANEVVGDLDIEVKLDKPGALRLNLFSHSADQYTNYLDNSQRNGIGLTYQREFSSFREFIRNLFSSKQKRQEREALRQDNLLNEEKARISIERHE